MSATPSSPEETPRPSSSHPVGWILFPLALFPLVALLSYDWRAIEALKSPPEPSSNWIGALGDSFAFYGYQMFGLAIWVIPAACVLWGICLVAGRRMRPGRREAWFFVVLLCAACLMQTMQTHAPGISALLERLNLANAGGAVGYLAMTRLLSPLLSDFGSSVVVLMLMAVALVAAIGLHNLIAFFRAIVRWALARSGEVPRPAGDATAEEQAAYLAALEAKEAVRREKETEKERARAEREAERLAKKEAERAAREAAREAREAAKEAARAEKDAARAERAQERAPLFAPRPEPALQPAPAAVPPPNAPESAQTPQAEQPQPPARDKGPYVLPGLDLLKPLNKAPANRDDVGVEETGQRLLNTLKLFGIEAKLADAVQGPVVTKYEIELAPGTRYSAVTSLSDNLMGAMRAKSLRIEAPIPGKDRVGIEVPNRKPAGISFREIFESDAWRKSNAELPLLFGKDAAGKELVADLATMPHMLVAGATGQGKSVCLNSLINGLLMTRTPEQLKLIMVDPKSVEFTPYAAIPHLLVPVITDNRKVVFALHWAVAEMEKRLKLFARARVRNIYDFNHRRTLTQTDIFGSGDSEPEIPKSVPYIVIIIDEVADLMSTSAKEVVPDISRLTAKARAAGIHLILATQRPDAKVIMGTIKANIPGRVAFKTAQAIDSRTILDDAGAENLIGRGDMLFKSKDGLLIRAQGAWISDEEIEHITKFIEEHADTQFDEKFATKLGRVKEASIDDPFASNEDDPDNQTPPEDSAAAGGGAREQVKAAENADLYKKAIEVIINTNRASVSHFQRKLGIGYNHAAKLCDKLEENGVIAPQSGAGPRTILLDQNQLMAIMNGNAPSTQPDAGPDGYAAPEGEAADGESAPQDGSDETPID